MKYYIIAGERSGDLHASNLIKSLKQEDPNAQVRAWGGELSEQAGAEIAMHYEKMAFMGFLEVVQNLNTIRKALQFCKDDILAYKPDVVILVDYAGFNMKVAKFTKSQGIRTYYYISPKIWAWNQGRANNIKKYVDKMFVILPFEKDFYKKFDYEVDYVGNPINDSVAAFSPNPNFRKENGLDERPIIAILPGSRKQEIEQMLHYMVSIVPSFGDYQFVVAAVPNFPKKYYEQFRRNIITIVYDQTYDLLQEAKAALVTSGTATLETALFEVPQVVCYKGSVITYWIARSLIKVRFISLVNLIADKEVVKELIQDDFTPNNLLAELKKLLSGSPARTQQLTEYKKIKETIGQAGASEKTAKLIIKYLKESGATN
ncbi:lipid-A-disaccharide synthase [Flexibacter flexilis DSM 6793]|uniref:Lipid-A-disaccharide synthase n=1 Tax=Flexibacter flexilis DSM 6793 TaxID=927664 RepID=A0A1I1KZ26_9BACT|nr:lipid-A-disaccharide synthase [Flexibacter flexilis]SFC63958.1 lipid-A-disaccharide synthase [Flexibacter flexilis DSM 6793]